MKNQWLKHSSPFESFLRAGALVLLMMLAPGCAGSGQQTGEETPRRPRRFAPRIEATPNLVALDLATPSAGVRTIQLFRTGNESWHPAIQLGSGQTLTLAFDLMEDVGRPLSVYFYHADRRWQRDLLPSEFLASFHRDDLHDYDRSHTTQLPYVHYEYEFPNASIQFRLSGNYILRVTEQGNEEAVLFERAFFVSEQTAQVEFGVRSILVGGQGWSSSQPLARFVPPDQAGNNVFDYKVCFARNGRYDLARCTESPSLITMPQLQFYLEPELAFEPEEGYRVVDLSTLRIGNQIVSIDFDKQPYEAVLESDFANLAGNTRGIFLGGQPAVRGVVRDVAEPDLAGEYVNVRFRYVPPEEKPLPGPVIVTGSFNGWVYDEANRLAWDEANRRYEGVLLLKQGVYEYRYFSPGVVQETRRGRLLPSDESLYTALIYYTDARLNTDRLIAVENYVAP